MTVLTKVKIILDQFMAILHNLMISLDQLVTEIETSYQLAIMGQTAETC